MLKKIGIAALIVVGGLFVLSKTGLVGSHVNTAWKKVRSSAQKQVPLEFEIERLRSEIAQIHPDVKRNVAKLAEEMVAVERLRKDNAAARERLAEQKENIRALAQALENGTQPVAFNGATFSARRAQEKLAADVAAARRAEEALKAREQLLEQKERGLDAARERLESMKAQKEELEVHLAQLEADLKTLRLAHTKSQTCVDMDDSRVAEIKKSLAALRNRLEVERVQGELMAEFVPTTTPAETKKAKTREAVVEEAKSYLNGSDDRRADQKN